MPPPDVVQAVNAALELPKIEEISLSESVPSPVCINPISPEPKNIFSSEQEVQQAISESISNEISNEIAISIQSMEI